MLSLSNKQIINTSLVFVAAFVLLFATKAVLADSYVVTASIAYPTPSQPATILNNATTTTNDRILISGNCEVISPSAIVSLWNGASLLGSAVCQPDGTYSVAVTLQPGQNNIVPRTSNIVNVYGPDGSPILFTYNAPPPSQTPSQPNASTPSTPTVPSAPAVPSLQISSQQPYGVLDTSGFVSLNVTVQGGETPYAISIRWGDGVTDTQTANEAGTYTFTHKYKEKKDYIAAVKVQDKNGRVSDYLVPFLQVKGVTIKNPQVASGSATIQGGKITLNAIVLTTAVFVIAVSTFVLGKHHQIRIHRRQTVKAKPKQGKVKKIRR